MSKRMSLFVFEGKYGIVIDHKTHSLIGSFMRTFIKEEDWSKVKHLVPDEPAPYEDQKIAIYEMCSVLGIDEGNLLIHDDSLLKRKRKSRDKSLKSKYIGRGNVRTRGTFFE